MTFVYANSREEADKFIFTKAEMEICVYDSAAYHMFDKLKHKMHKIIFVNREDSFIRNRITMAIMDNTLNFVRGQYVVIVRGKEFNMIEKVNWNIIEQRPIDFLDVSMVGGGDYKELCGYLYHIQKRKA